jgi:hypothetical protein
MTRNFSQDTTLLEDVDWNKSHYFIPKFLNEETTSDAFLHSNNLKKQTIISFFLLHILNFFFIFAWKGSG